MPPGDYTLKLRLADHLLLADVKVAAGAVTTVDLRRFRRAHFADDPVKGTGLTTLYAQHWSVSASGGYQAIFDAPTARGGTFPSAPLVGLEGTLHHFFGRGWGLGLDFAVGSASGQVSSPLLQGLPYDYSVLTLGGALLREWQPEATLVPFAGVRVGLELMQRTFPGTALPRQSYASTSPGLVGGLSLRLTRQVSLTARARLHYLLYTVDETKSLGYADLGLLLDYEMRD